MARKLTVEVDETIFLKLETMMKAKSWSVNRILKEMITACLADESPMADTSTKPMAAESKAHGRELPKDKKKAMGDKHEAVEKAMAIEDDEEEQVMESKYDRWKREGTTTSIDNVGVPKCPECGKTQYVAKADIGYYCTHCDFTFKAA